MALFGRVGRVVMVRICQPGGGPRTTAQTVSVKNLTTSNEARAASTASCSPLGQCANDRKSRACLCSCHAQGGSMMYALFLVSQTGNLVGVAYALYM